jgi:hypothetical protein
MIERPILRIHGVEEGAEIQIKDMRNLVNEIILAYVTTLCNDIDTHVGEPF